MIPKGNHKKALKLTRWRLASLTMALLTLASCQSNDTSKESTWRSSRPQQPSQDTTQQRPSQTLDMIQRHPVLADIWKQQLAQTNETPTTDTPPNAQNAPDTPTTKPHASPCDTPSTQACPNIANHTTSLHKLATPNTQKPTSKNTPTTAQRLADAFPPFADPNRAGETITLNFEQTDIRDVINTVSDITGINFIPHDNVQGTVTVLSPTQIPYEELYSFLESVLLVNGFTALPGADHVKILPRNDTPQLSLPIRIGGNPDDIPLTDSPINQIITLHYADAAELATFLRSSLSAGGKLETYSPTNALLLTDTSANVHRLAQIIQQMDVPQTQEEVKVFTLHYAPAQDLAAQISAIIEKRYAQTATTRRPNAAARKSPPQIEAEPRTNRLIVIASARDIQRIEQLVQQLDVPRPTGADTIHVLPLQNAPAEEVAEALAPIIPNLRPANTTAYEVPISVVPDPGTRSLIISAPPQEFLQIARAVQKLDIVREKVLVELLIVEVSEDNLRQIGVDWATLDQAVSDSVRGFGFTDFGLRSAALNGTLEGLGVGAFKDVGGNIQIAAILNALQTVTEVNILSTPHVTTTNHKEAKIVVASNVPFITQNRINEDAPTTQPVIQTIDYRDVGVILTITPHASPNGTVQMEIDTELSQLVDASTSTGPSAPTTSKRLVTTEITLANGSTGVIGGLIRDDKTVVEDKVPFLGDLPIIGGLFKVKRDHVQKTNLLIFITPHILTNSKDVAEAKKRKQDEITPELSKRVNKEQASPSDLLDSFWQ